MSCNPRVCRLSPETSQAVNGNGLRRILLETRRSDNRCWKQGAVPVAMEAGPADIRGSYLRVAES